MRADRTLASVRAFDGKERLVGESLFQQRDGNQPILTVRIGAH